MGVGFVQNESKGHETPPNKKVLYFHGLTYTVYERLI